MKTHASQERNVSAVYIKLLSLGTFFLKWVLTFQIDDVSSEIVFSRFVMSIRFTLAPGMNGTHW